MPATTVRRTLLKSAPELWAQVGDPEALARRFPDVEGIRIVRTERQHHIAWEGEQASGEVILEPAGFGTKVTLTVARGGRGAPTPVQPGTDVGTPAQPRPERPGFFARFFRRAPPAVTTPGVDAASGAALDSMPEQPTEIFDVLAAEEEDLPAENQVAPAPAPVDPEHVDARLLEAALDSLGNDHHRPFSRG